MSEQTYWAYPPGHPMLRPDALEPVRRLDVVKGCEPTPSPKPTEADIHAVLGDGPFPTENPRDRDIEAVRHYVEDRFEEQCKLHKLTSSERACVLSHMLHKLNERFVAIERRSK